MKIKKRAIVKFMVNRSSGGLVQETAVSYYSAVMIFILMMIIINYYCCWELFFEGIVSGNSINHTTPIGFHKGRSCSDRFSLTAC